MRYISIEFRTRILELYKSINGSDTSTKDLDWKIFGNPEMRAKVDEVLELADEEIEKDRFQQFSDEWLQFAVKHLPAGL